MTTENKPIALEFARVFKGTTLPPDAFLEVLLGILPKNEIRCLQTKEKTGEAKTAAIGMTTGGSIGGGLANSDIITSKWNPFKVLTPAKKYALLGQFEGIIKITEVAKYHRKKNDTDYELRDYNLIGHFKFVPRNVWLIVLAALGGTLGMGSSKECTSTALILFIAFPVIFYGVAQNLGNKEMQLPTSRINDGMSQVEEYLKKHNTETLK